MNTSKRNYPYVVYSEADRPLTEFAMPLAEIIRLLSPAPLKKRSKWICFLKEIMLLASSRKPTLTK